LTPAGRRGLPSGPQDLIDEARRRTADLGGGVRCQVGDVQRLELGDGVVDGVRTERS
jgi:hypothetical protein